MKRLLSLLLVFCMTVPCMAFAANAAEAKTGNVTFKLVDDTNGEFGEDITMTLTSQGSNKSYEFVFSASDNYKEATYSLAYGYVYDVVFSYPSKDTGAYHIITRSGGEIEPIRVDEDEITLNWLIIAIGGEDMPTEPDRLDEEAPLIWEEFLAVAQNITEDNPDCGRIYNYLSSMEDLLAKHYETYCGKPMGDWYTFTSYEQMLVYYLWLMPCQIEAYNQPTYYLANEDKFLYNGLNTKILDFSYCGEEAEEAYRTIMSWNYFYYMQRGEFYNFVSDITERNAPATEPTEPLEVQPQEPSVEATKPATAETKVAATEPTEPQETKPAEEKTGWAAVAEGLKGNVITIVLLLIGGGALLYITVIKKQKNIDD